MARRIDLRGPAPLEDRKPVFMPLETWLELTMVPKLQAAIALDEDRRRAGCGEEGRNG